MINSASVAIGSTKMNVTNYDLPASVETTVYESCVSGGAASTTITKLYGWTIQEGVVPGTDFSLVSQYHYIASVTSNSTSSFGNINWKVTSFTLG